MKAGNTALFLVLLLALGVNPSVQSKGDGFNEVVKLIERFYHVKHESIPFLARAGMKAARTAARIKGGEARRFAEAGSVRVAIFEDQTFDSHGQIATFKSQVQIALSEDWAPLIQTLSAKNEEQSYIYVRDTGEKFHVLIVEIDRHDGTVVQATVSPQVFAELLRDPNGMGKTLTEEATIVDP